MTLVQPTPEMQVMIRQELNEDVNTRDASVQAIQEWLSKQPHLPDHWDDDRIMSFLRGSNFSLERCKKKLDLYFTMRTAAPEFFANRDIHNPQLQEILQYVTCPPLPGVTKEGRRVMVLRGKDKNFHHPPAEDAIKLLFMVGDIRLSAEEIGVAGDVYILDAGVVTPTHFAKVTPALVKKFLVCVEDAYPVKLKEIHIVNAHPLVDTIYTWVKPLLKDKIKNRVHIHSDGLESLYKFVPQEMLPEEYGGSVGKIQDLHDQWLKRMEDYNEWFKEQESFKADESKRPGKPTNYDDLFGVDGSFKQLTID